MSRWSFGLWSLCLVAAPAAEPTGIVGQVNTLWVVPAQRFAWVEPLYCRRRPGGGLYLLDGFTVRRDIGWSIHSAIRFLEARPDVCPGFAAGWRAHDLYFYWGDNDQPRAGPSAGVAFAVAAYSAIADLPVLTTVGFSGGIEPDGRVLEVGGVEYKLSAALAAGLRVLCIPRAGAPPPEAIPLEIARRLRVVALDRAEEAFFEAYGYDGPEARRYDRVETLYHDFREAYQRRQAAPARLALDELLELHPGDLSARRLRRQFERVDMTQAARNLFADAAMYERDGLPDVALATARRAWGYADEATRQQHAPLLGRLEQAQLPEAERLLLARARELAARGEVAAAWRLLEDLRRRQPQQPYLARLAADWQDYGAVARLEDAVQLRPDDLAARAALAQTYAAAGVIERAVETYAELAARQPEQFSWLAAPARLLAARNDPPGAAALLRRAAARHPVETAALARELRLELTPPRLEVAELRRSGRLAQGLLRATDASGPPTLGVTVGGRPPVELTANEAWLTVDLGRLPEGRLELVVAATDRFGNRATRTTELVVPAPRPGGCVEGGQPPAAWPATEVYVAPGEHYVVPVGTRLIIDGGGWFADLPDLEWVGFVDGEEARRPPFRLTRAVTGPGLQRLRVRAGEVVREVTVEALERPGLWFLEPTGETATAPVEVRLGTTFTPGPITLLDGPRPVLEAAGDQRLTIPPTAARARSAGWTASLRLPDGRLVVAPPLGVAALPPVALAREPIETPATLAEAIVLPTTAAALTAVSELPEPLVRTAPAAGPVRLERLTVDPPQVAVDWSQTALRLDAGPPPVGRLLLSIGDALAFAHPALPLLQATGDIAPGPLATTAWRPRETGTYRFRWPGGEALVEVVPDSGLALPETLAGRTLREPLRLELSVAPALPVAQLSLVVGDRPVATWPAPPEAILIEPAQLPAGQHLLRLVARLTDGDVAISPPVVVETE